MSMINSIMSKTTTNIGSIMKGLESFLKPVREICASYSQQDKDTPLLLLFCTLCNHVIKINSIMCKLYCIKITPSKGSFVKC